MFKYNQLVFRTVKSLKIIFFCIVILFTFIFTSCTKEKEDDIIIGHEFSEELINSEQVNPELYNFSTSDIVMQQIIDGKKGLIIFITQVQDGIVYFRGYSQEGNLKFEINSSQLEWGEKPVLDIEVYIDEIFSVENGNIDILKYISDDEKVIMQINPYTKEVVYEQKILGDNIILANMSSEQTLFYNLIEKKILVYDNFSGKLQNEIIVPGITDEITNPGCSKITEFEGYYYLFNKSGIYRAEKKNLTFKCLIEGTETRYINEKMISLGDIVLKSENNIYISFGKNFNFDGTSAKKYIIEYKICTDYCNIK